MDNLALLACCSGPRDVGLLQQCGRRATCRQGMEHCEAITVKAWGHSICKHFGLIFEVAVHTLAHWHIAGLLLVVRGGVHGEAPGLVLRPIRIPAVVVVAQPVRWRGVDSDLM